MEADDGAEDAYKDTINGMLTEGSSAEPTVVRAKGVSRRRAQSLVRNDPQGVLATWTALEVLSPQCYKRAQELAENPGCVAWLTAGIPWGKGEQPRPKCNLYYQIIIGCVAVDRAMRELEKVFGRDEESSRRTRDKAAIAAIVVDHDGFPVLKNGVAVSSFAWALPLALNRQLEMFGSWASIEKPLVRDIEELIQRHDADGQARPLDLDTIQKVYEELVGRFELPARLVEPPTFAIRVHHPVRRCNPPEAAILNSFYLEDIKRVSLEVQQGTAPEGMRRYLAIDNPGPTVDLLKDRTALERSLAPGATPAARWPQPGAHSLVTLQQAAVNVVRAELAGKQGIAAINGPPGTGKTTLLRDLIAQCAVDRALVMSEFDDPNTAFVASGLKVTAGPHAFIDLYSLDSRLKGHEIVVASSNNKAVENVSRQIPAAAEVGRSSDQLTYFKSISDFLFGPRRRDEGETSAVARGLETWGLIAAVLGKSRNRSVFKRAFWWDDDRSFRQYLKAAKGDNVFKEYRDPETGKIERRIPMVVTREQPPAPSIAKANWRNARERLLALKADIDRELAQLEQLRQTCLELTRAREPLITAERQLQELATLRAAAQAEATDLQAQIEAATNEFRAAQGAFRDHRRVRPGFLTRIFRTARWRAWKTEDVPLAVAQDHCGAVLASLKRTLLQTSTRIETLSSQIRAAESALATPRRRVADLEKSLEPWRGKLGNRLADDRFFCLRHEELNLSSAWLTEELQSKREDLFVAAMAVHKAFIDMAAQKFLHNLSVLIDVLNSGTEGNEARKQLLQDLWSTLFLVVPVISTTFASVHGMLGELPPESIGWLFIDEAGQATPQAAAGAILRAKRTVLVGDPLQIPPVVTMPKGLIKEICSFFNVDKPLWSAPDASAQALADRAAKYQSAFESDTGPRPVGVPLLVHRRCQDPMFSISNAIAYNGLMVHAPGPKQEGPIAAALESTCWFGVDGDAASKWCPLEGKVVIGLLRKLAAARVWEPDLFIITPFRIVAQEMRRLLEQPDSPLEALTEDLQTWTKERIGTVHTFQGDQADTVILLLGAPMASQNGAREWATATPNILNVAVSRAKQNFYVVGSYGAWAGAGYCREIAARLRVTRI